MKRDYVPWIIALFLASSIAIAAPIIQVAGTGPWGGNMPVVGFPMGATDATGKLQQLEVNGSGELLVACSGCGGGGGTVTVDNAAGAAAVNIQDGGNTITVDGTVTAAQATAANLNATVVGTGTFATQAAQSGMWTVQPGNTANTTPWLVQAAPAATGGLTKFTLQAAASTNATNVKASAGTVYNVSAFGISATPAWVTFYDTAGVPTCGTGVVWQTVVPGVATGAGGISDIAAGLSFSTGIGICVTTGIAGSGAVAANTFVLNIGYK